MYSNASSRRSSGVSVSSNAARSSYGQSQTSTLTPMQPQRQRQRKASTFMDYETTVSALRDAKEHLNASQNKLKTVSTRGICVSVYCIYIGPCPLSPVHVFIFLLYSF